MPVIGSRAGVSSRGYGEFSSVSTVDIPQSGLSLYLDASNPISYPGSGTTWYDLSGNNKNFTWATSPSFNSSGVKYFNTLNNAANGPASNSFNITNTSGYTIFLTMYQNSALQASSFKWYSSNGAGVTSQARGIFSHATWSENNVYWDQGGCCNSDTRTNVLLGNPVGSWHVIGYRNNYAATNRTIWDGSSIIQTNTSAIANINLDSRAAQIASSDEYGGNASVWNARIGQFVLYNKPLSDSEMVSVINKLKIKVGI